MKRFTCADEAFRYYFKHIKTQCGITGAQVYEENLFDGTAAIFNTAFTLIFPNSYEIETHWRRWNQSYAELEYEWYRTGDRNPAMVETHAKIWAEIKDERGYVNSNYGYWWKRNDQLEKAILLLKEKPDTRRAIITHYSPDELDQYGKDMPCNVVLNFFIKDGALNLTVFARSIDLVYGFCNDQYCFARLMIDVSDRLGVDVGEMTYMITNLHIYPKHWYIDDRPEPLGPSKLQSRRNKLKNNQDDTI